MKRTISLIILCSMLASLAACGSTSDGKTPTDGTSGSDNTTTSATETTDPTLVPPEATDEDIQGKTYRIFNGYSDQTKYVTNDIYPEGIDRRSPERRAPQALRRHRGQARNHNRGDRRNPVEHQEQHRRRR